MWDRGTVGPRDHGTTEPQDIIGKQLFFKVDIPYIKKRNFQNSYCTYSILEILETL